MVRATWFSHPSYFLAPQNIIFFFCLRVFSFEAKKYRAVVARQACSLVEQARLAGWQSGLLNAQVLQLASSEMINELNDFSLSLRTHTRTSSCNRDQSCSISCSIYSYSFLPVFLRETRHASTCSFLHSLFGRTCASVFLLLLLVVAVASCFFFFFFPPHFS